MTEEAGRTYQSKRSLTTHVARKADANDNEEFFLGMATLDDIERKFKTISIQSQNSSTNVNFLKNFGSSLRGTGKVTFNFAETTRAISQSQPSSPGAEKLSTNPVKNKINYFRKAFEMSKQQSLLGKVGKQANQEKPSENSLFQRLKALSQHESLGKQIPSQQNNLTVSNRGSGQVSNTFQHHQQPYPSSVRGSQILNGYSLANLGKNMHLKGVQTARNSSLAQPPSSRSSQSEIKFQSGRFSKDKEVRSSNALTVNTELSLSSSLSSEPKINAMRNQRASLIDLVSMQLSNQRSKNVLALKQGIAEQTGGINGNAENLNNNQDSAALSQFQLDNLAGFIYEIVNIPFSSSSNNSKMNPQNLAQYYSKVDRIFESFGIDQKKLLNMDSSESKEEYIVSSIQQQCARQLSDLVEKVQLRTKQSQDQEEKEKMKTTKHSNIGEYFNWIKLPSKHHALKKKLQQSLVEVLYGHGHIQELEKQNKNYTEQCQSNEKNISSEGNSSPSISEIAQDVKPQRKSIFQNGKRSASVPKVEVDEIEVGLQTGGVEQNNLGVKKDETWIEGRRQLISRLQKNISIEQSAIKQLPMLNNIEFLKNQENLSAKLKQFQWNGNVEKAFEEYKNAARSDCVGIRGMNKWQSIGMQPVIQMLGLEEKLDLYREQLIRKFREEGYPLTEKEKLFIINTSELLNSNIDRQHFQEILDFVSQDDINLLELRIAENLLQKYSVIGEELKTIRQQYLAEKNTKTLEGIAYNDRNGTILDSIRSSAAAKLNQKLLRLSVERTKRMLENKKETIHYFLSIRNNPFVKHFARQLKRAIAHREIVKKQSHTSNLTTHQIEFARRNYPDKSARKLLFTYQNGEDIVPMTVRQSQQIYHPNSRVLLGLSELRKTEEFLQKGELRVLTGVQQKQLKSLEVQKAKLMISKNSTPKLNINETHQPLFKSIYSNGPIDLLQHQNNSNDPNGIGSLKRTTSKQPWINQEVENKAATIVQKWIRGRIQHMKYKTLLHFRKDAEDKQMFQILKHWKESKELIVYIRDETKKLVANQQQKMNKMRSRVSNTGSCSNFPEFNGEFTSKTNGNVSRNQESNTHEEIQNLFNSNQNFSSSSKLQKQQQQQLPGTQQNQLPSSQQLQNLDIDHSISSIDSKQSYQHNNNVKQSNQHPTQPTPRVLSSSQRNRKERSIENSLSATRSTLDFHSGLLSNRHGGFIPVESSSSVVTPLGQKQKIKTNEQQHNISNMSYKNLSQVKQLSINNLKNTTKQQQQLQGSSEKPSNVQEVDNDDETKSVKKGVFRQKNKEDFQLKQKRLFFAAKQSTLSAVLNSGFAFYPQDFNAIDEFHNTPLYYVTIRGDEQFISYLLTGGADVNIRCSDNNTALHAAFGLGQIKVIIELIDNGGDLNLVNNAGMTPLALGSISLLKELGLEKGATTVIAEKATFTQFDNNALFNRTHNVVPEAFRDYSGPAAVIRKKREKIAEDEMQQEMINFEFVKKIGHQGENQELQEGIKVARNVVLPNKSIAPFVETFIPKVSEIES